MKNIKKLSTGIIALMLAMSSCSDEDPITSSVTVYPVITVTGDNPYYINAGETYTDPGVTATIGDTDVPITTTFVGRYRGNTSSTLDTNIADVYSAEYSATNEDGFSTTKTREVIVTKTGDLVNSIEGLYTSTVFRNGVQPAATAGDYTDIEYILIWKNADGSYGISDAFGGWYLFGRAIADSETPGGKIVANSIPTNNFSFPGTLTNKYFGGTANITGLTVNPTAKTIDVTTVWAADASTTYTFTFKLTQVQL